jgi:hypothetical protein
LLKESHFQSSEDIHKKTEELLKALSQNYFGRFSEARMAHMEWYVASDEDYVERDNI